jgi:5-methylcytosine-specific restriction enzyme B
MSSLTDSELEDQGVMPPTDFTQNIDRISEISKYRLQYPAVLTDLVEAIQKEFLVAPHVLEEILVALRAGNIIIQGPPGTGKTTLARLIARAMHSTVYPVTAHEDWTVYELIGRLELRVNANGAEDIVPVDGYFTEAVIKCANSVVKHFDDPDHPQAEWLLIDEINRCHIDKAFGELFSVMGTDGDAMVTLPHQREGNRDLVVPSRFRIIGTLNSFDRQFVNNLSQAIRRRFTFITLDIPPRRRAGGEWSIWYAGPDLALKEFDFVINRAVTRVVSSMDLDGQDEEQRMVSGTRSICEERLLATLSGLFEFVELFRYSGAEEELPFLPIGTAQLIDTVELFLSRMMFRDFDVSFAPEYMDWAASVKIAPLFDADSVVMGALENLVTNLPGLFAAHTGRELKKLASGGMFYVGG